MSLLENRHIESESRMTSLCHLKFVCLFVSTIFNQGAYLTLVNRP